jgi:hypothetical protein
MNTGHYCSVQLLAVHGRVYHIKITCMDEMKLVGKKTLQETLKFTTCSLVTYL